MTSGVQTNSAASLNGAGKPEPLLEVKNLVKHFPIKGGLLRRTVATVKAVDGVSFQVLPGETLGIVGESGCGKTTTGRTVLRLEEPTAGNVLFQGQDVLAASTAQMKALRRDMQIVFQDPYASLNPRVSIGESIAEGLVQQVLATVGLHRSHMSRFPHEFSGGQRQRIGIARALVMNPKLIVCDEPVSALDVSIQSQVINLLRRLQQEFGLTYLFIAHNLSVVEHISDRVGVMYLGKMVELAKSETLFHHPMHPYTKALISAIPSSSPKARRQRIILPGDVPSPINPPSGCRFHPRCWMARDICKHEEPAFEEKEPGHWSACHFAHEVS
jgi:peptide/nickel transport system ATP-binding protein/oligopeptide transport system ATP-binding protein